MQSREMHFQVRLGSGGRCESRRDEVLIACQVSLFSRQHPKGLSIEVEDECDDECVSVCVMLTAFLKQVLKITSN